MLREYHVGTLDKASLEVLKHQPEQKPSLKSHDIFLEPRSWLKAKFCKKRTVSHDTRIFTFALEHDKQILGLPIGQHLMLKVQDSSPQKENIIRAYTPISKQDSLGTVELLVKIYFSSPAVKGGKMTMALESLTPGSLVEIKGPIGKFTYLGKGKISLNGKERSVQSFRMICCGSGITPIFQILRAVMQDPEDTTTCVVLDGNRKEDDILCKDDLDAFAAADSRKCSIVYTLTNASSSWAGVRGRISAQLLREYVTPEIGTVVLLCGPEAMEKSVCEILLDHGWDESDLVFF